MEREDEYFSSRSVKRPTWNAALFAGGIASGGATSLGQWLVMTSGMLLGGLCLSLVIRLL
jgi:hypothetical protein